MAFSFVKDIATGAVASGAVASGGSWGVCVIDMVSGCLSRYEDCDETKDDGGTGRLLESMADGRHDTSEFCL